MKILLQTPAHAVLTIEPMKTIMFDRDTFVQNETCGTLICSRSEKVVNSKVIVVIHS